MKNILRFLTILLVAIFLPLTVHAAAGYFYESDFSTGKIFHFTTTTSGTAVKLTFATGLTEVRALDRGGRRAFP
jgi:hypothetical protein